MSLHLNKKMLGLCRLCQLKPGIYKLLNDDLIEQIFTCTNIKVDDNLFELLPPSICKECKEMICKFFDYLQKVKKTDNDLRKLVKDVEYLNEDAVNQATCKSTSTDFKVKKHMCPVCSKQYSRLTSFNMHKKRHSELFCYPCEISFDNALEKTEHICKNLDEIRIQNLKNGSSNLDLADDSKPKFDSSKDVDSVADKNIGNNNKEKGSFKCKVCTKEFIWKVDFWLHKKIHETNFICKWENCKKICTSAYTLKTHEMKHEGKRPFLCVTCGKGFVTKNSLTCHEKIHQEVKAYNCKLCSIGFSVKSNLRAHEKKYHEGIRFYCSQCTRAYISKASLERHERLHTGIKDFPCDSCPSAFYTNKELVKHQRYHQGIRPHKCSQCFKTFFEKHHLTIHLRSHTGERPYICKIVGCGKSFTESQKLTRHLKATHINIK